MRTSRISVLAAYLLVLTAFFFSSYETAWAFLDNLLGKKQTAAQQTNGWQYPIQDEASFNANTKSFHKLPFGDPSLEFDILLPKDWTNETALSQDGSSGQLSQKILGEIARFKSPMIGTVQAVVVIKTLHLDRETSAGFFLKNLILTSGASIQGDVIPVDDRRANIAFISTVDGVTTYIYETLQINGSTAMLAQFEIPLRLKEGMDFIQKRTIDSFRVIQKTDDPVETQKAFTFGESLKFVYPESWMLRYPDFKDPRNIAVQLHNEIKEAKNKKLEGMIRFRAIRRDPQTSLKQEIKNMQEKYFAEFLGVKFKKMISSDKATVYSRFLFSRDERYIVETTQENKSASEQEVRLVALGDNEWYIFIFLLSPTEAINTSAWAYDNRVLDLILRSLK